MKIIDEIEMQNNNNNNKKKITKTNKDWKEQGRQKL